MWVSAGEGQGSICKQQFLIQIGSQLGRHVFSRVGDWWVIGHTRLFHGSVLDWWWVVEAKVAVSGFSADGRRGMFAFTRHFLHSCLFTRSSMGVISLRRMGRGLDVLSRGGTDGILALER